MTRKTALRTLAGLAGMTNFPRPSRGEYAKIKWTLEINLNDYVEIGVTYKGERKTIKISELFEAL